MSQDTMPVPSLLSPQPDDRPEPFSITVSGAPLDDQRRVLKHQDTFALFDRFGDAHPLGHRGQAGLYHDGTRFLSRLELTIDGAHPLLLHSAVDEENVTLRVDLTNPDLQREGLPVTPHGALHVHRAKLLRDGACMEKITVCHYEPRELSCTVRLDVAADYVDVFEVRGLSRPRRGQLLKPHPTNEGITFAYRGLDGVLRQTHISCDPPPTETTARSLIFDFRLAPRVEVEFCVSIKCRSTEALCIGFEEVRQSLSSRFDEFSRQACRISTSNAQFNRWVNRSYADLFMMLSDTAFGVYPYAGVPWYNTVFGRDGIITALQLLWAMPELARGVLGFLAEHQAAQADAERDAEPGKIVHEMRGGEMAALDEIPFRRYYGTVDATPLFVLLAAQYLRRTGDFALIEGIWPSVERALQWMHTYGGERGDGFIRYRRRGASGLLHQGWKDSADCIFHADGSLADAPIAPCEVQAYAYGALRGAAAMAQTLRRPALAPRLMAEARRLRSRFHKTFWVEELGTFALALDGSQRPCRVRTSNAGQCLFTGVVHPRYAARLAGGLMDDGLFSGWGIRTVDAREARYNPMSYHNGSVWPHDTALVATGLARYGFADAVNRLFGAMFEASTFMELNRLPELFCGFPRRRAEGPTLYPVACSPQAWASGCVFMFLQACLSMRIDAVANRIVFRRPVLPEFLNEVALYNLRVGETAVDLRLYRYKDAVGVRVLRGSGQVNVVVLK